MTSSISPAAAAATSPPSNSSAPSDAHSANTANPSESNNPKPKEKSKMRGRPTDSPDVQLSKTLSYILRHGAAKEGLKMRKDGYIAVEDILKRPKMKGVDVPMVERIVAENAKQRFALAREPDPQGGVGEVLLIRANQGHSVEVEELELTPVLDASEVPVAVHGTYRRFWKSIEREGLKTMNRTHVHCAHGIVGEDGVISGMRASCDLLIYLDVPKCLSNGITFFRSSNGVILTAGLAGTKSVPKEYFEKVLERKTGKVLFPVSEA